MKQKHLDFFEYLKELKNNNKLEIVDTHVHPLDVMGVVHPSEVGEEIEKELNLEVGMLESLNFGRLSNYISRKAFKYLPKVVFDEIKGMYHGVSEKRILSEMDKSLVDKIVLLPVEPWVSTDEVGQKFQDKRFIHLASLDIHSIKTGDIEKKIKEYKKKYNIVGLKLHPNLQDFKPQPTQNKPEISEKLKIIYQTAEKMDLYILFHGGMSTFTDEINDKYGNQTRSRTNAKLSNFINEDGKSEIIGKYKNPIIIAHLGHQCQNKVDKELIKVIQKFPNVYFDTAGISPKMISDALDILGEDRIILGSDGLYNKMFYSAYLVFLAAKKKPMKKDEIMCKILGENYKKILGGNGRHI